MEIHQVTFMLIERLEHIPVDSIWAQRASGTRGSKALKPGIKFCFLNRNVAIKESDFGKSR